MKDLALTVLQVVSHCAGRLIPPIEHERDEVSVRVRIVAAYILSPTGRYPTGATRHARKVVQHAARAGDDCPLVELLTLAIGALAAVPVPKGGSDAGVSPIGHTLPMGKGPDVGVPDAAGGGEQRDGPQGPGPAAPTPAAEGLQPARPCPPNRRTCDRSTCRHYLGPDAPHPCVLEVARHGPLQGPVIAAIMGGVSRQRIAELERRALRKLQPHRHLLEAADVRRLTYAEQLELAAPGRLDIALRGAPEDWRR